MERGVKRGVEHGEERGGERREECGVERGVERGGERGVERRSGVLDRSSRDGNPPPFIFFRRLRLRSVLLRLLFACLEMHLPAARHLERIA